ncbi:hypothetical protein NXS98_07245 [Fontisphaera persica]|uniref:hypothetical protein n=1 Tax=Fontisphaera persica TaxID=2974023 RepID=UPI0024C08DF5|nr:hypothetical protein [Fontisphaera persica]WCJ60908.1 hypothetical protein NXS98_07245 [Fontisphaera persica]
MNPLNWEAVVEIAISQPHPADWWDTILTAIGHLGTLRSELRARVITTTWLRLIGGVAVRPADLLHISGAENELDNLPDGVLRGKIPLLRLAPEIRNHNRFETFIKTVIPRPDESIKLLVELLKQHSQWRTGLTGEWNMEQCRDWTDALGDAPVEVLPVASFSKRCLNQKK